jgi:hypothetical protein
MNDAARSDRQALTCLDNTSTGVTKSAKHHAPLSKAEQIVKAKQEKEALRQWMIQERADKAARLAAERNAEALLKAHERALTIDAIARRLTAAKAERDLRTARARADAEDVASMKKHKNDRRRESLAFRNQEASRIAALLADQQHKDQAHFHESVVVCGRAEFDDVGALKQAAAARRRDSLAYRNGEATRQSASSIFKQGVEKALAATTDGPLLRGNYDDVSALKKQADQRKRESLAWRNQNASRQAGIAEDHQAEAVEAAADETEKAFQDAADVAALKKQADQRKRESLAWRNQNASRQAGIAEDHQAEAVEAAAEETEKAFQDAADVAALKKQADQRKRESLAWRNRDASRIASLNDNHQAAARAAADAATHEAKLNHEALAFAARAAAAAQRQDLEQREREAAKGAEAAAQAQAAAAKLRRAAAAEQRLAFRAAVGDAQAAARAGEAAELAWSLAVARRDRAAAAEANAASLARAAAEQDTARDAASDAKDAARAADVAERNELRVSAHAKKQRYFSLWCALVEVGITSKTDACACPWVDAIACTHALFFVFVAGVRHSCKPRPWRVGTCTPRRWRPRRPSSVPRYGRARPRTRRRKRTAPRSPPSRAASASHSHEFQSTSPPPFFFSRWRGLLSRCY